MKRLPILLLGLAVFFGTVWPSVCWLTHRHAADFETFHCAARTALAGADPWSIPDMVRTACPKQCWPYLYPAPSLLLLAPFALLPLGAAVVAWSVLNFASAALALWLLRRWSGISTPLLLAVTAIFIPLCLSLEAGQVNLPVLALIAAFLAHGSGAALAAAALIKMSPALLLAPALFARQGRTLLAFAGTGALLLAASLLVVPLSGQVRFFTEVLPRFTDGYPGLDLSMYLTDNHSIARGIIGVWPCVDSAVLSPPARIAYHALVWAILGALVLWTLRTGPGRHADGVWVVFMTIAPVFAWGAHLVFLLPAIFLALAAVERGRLRGAWAAAVITATLLLALPYDWLRWPGFYFPEVDWLFRDSKLLAGLLIGAACVELHARDQTYSRPLSPL